MKLRAILRLVCVALFVTACSQKPSEEPTLQQTAAQQTPSEETKEVAGDSPDVPAAAPGKSPGELIVGTWEYDLKYRSGDVVPCVRVFEKDGTGRQYATSAGEAGAQKFKWEIVEGGKAVNLAYGETGAMSLKYAIDKLDEATLIMTPPTQEAKEECKRR